MLDRSQEMVEELKKSSTPAICGYVERGGEILLVEPPFTFSPRPHYTPTDLDNAVRAGLLEKRLFIGSVSLEFFGLALPV